MILVNGVTDGAVGADDRGLAYGDGVFRTLRARSGVPLHCARHYRKLADDCAALALRAPDEALLAAEVKAACARYAECSVKIIVTRGTGPRGYRYRGDEAPTRIVIAEPVSERPALDRVGGAAVRLCTIRLAPQPALAGVKHLNRLENVLARAEWSDPEIGEGLLRDTEDNVICGTMSNLFLVRGGSLASPRLDRCGVAGVTRARVIEAAAQHDVACVLSALTWRDVLRADEVFLVNSLFGVCPVRALDGEPREPGPLTRALQAWLDSEDDAQVA
ncbi:MAG TPA: aminodeoxychorismate lyase [Burkholderiales bacterium]|nr:aminodeoxychorismate lyase [Burkholderiales bacterium]